MKKQENCSEESLANQLEKLKKDLDAVFTFVDTARDLREAKDLINDYLLPRKRYKNEPKERIVPIDYYEKAKFILQNFHADYDRYRACLNYNKTHKTSEFKYYGITQADFYAIRREIIFLKNAFKTSLKDYAQLFNNMFVAGLSLQKYATKYLPDKKKKTAEYAVNCLYEALAKEYALADSVLADRKLPNNGELPKEWESAVYNQEYLKKLWGETKYEEYVYAGIHKFLDEDQ